MLSMATSGAFGTMTAVETNLHEEQLEESGCKLISEEHMKSVMLEQLNDRTAASGEPTECKFGSEKHLLGMIHR